MSTTSSDSNEVPYRIMRIALKAQRAELTEYHIYRSMAKIVKNENNAEVLSCMADDELRHYQFWKDKTGRDVRPDRLKIWVYRILSRALGLSFGLNLMERGENLAKRLYNELAEHFPDTAEIAKDEDQHEETCIAMIEEERLRYASSIVLGLNDALVELTGAIAGLTFALRNTELVAVAALITGIAASLSMGASEYLSTRTDDLPIEEKHPVKAALYTGVAYVISVVILVAPYLLLSNLYGALAWTLGNALVIILAFTFYISVAKGYSFKRRFGEMAAVSMGVAAVSFVIGFFVRSVLGVEV
jgi:VIT1/CCC1 family predicted Fe2+/Mn2+ transporter